MKQFVKSLQQEVQAKLCRIEKQEGDVLKKMHDGVLCLEESFVRLKTFMKAYSFEDGSQEILFFKKYKPELACHLIFYRKKYSIELSRPAGGHAGQITYLEKELSRIRDYFDKTASFYCYYRSGGTHLDHLYFLRRKPCIGMHLESFCDERDPSFSTVADFQVAKIRANELLEDYLKEKIWSLQQEPNQDELYALPKTKVTWTSKKIDLLELIYELYCARSLNNGQISINKLVAYFESVFNIDLSSTSERAWYNLTIRENPTTFLDRMRKLFRERMEDEYRKNTGKNKGKKPEDDDDNS
ncbi:RteC protein [Dysgonomonas alginatilytica]|uniref:RteC protein n=1 Tax=Dysgonomonas alginatilytica TaxID=1605892 RepID=A0A2V3PJV5_9BACT|nr:RteC domain-containing protein [Dysgonomonas alginatilytica]PXV58863.1 RteC protein [Dysgonomonas alginatilytica]